MARTYNDTFNSTVEWQPDGSHLTMPGMTPEITLRPFQKNGIWRAVAGRNNTLFSWGSWTGQDGYANIGTAMEWRRLGLKKKPMIVVLYTPLFHRQQKIFQKMYPAANVLAADKDSFKTMNRKEFLSRIATGDWDSVIVGDSQVLLGCRLVALPQK